MIYGGAERLRVSSQSLKRAIRTSPAFWAMLGGYVGTRAQTFGQLLEDVLMAPPYSLTKEEAAKKAAMVIANDKLGKIKNGSSDTEQLAHLAPEELARLKGLATRVANANELSEKETLVLVERPKAADIAMFGRMLADNPRYNIEAAAQVAHAFTTHRAVVEDDYFTAVDELKAERKEADKGAGFVGVQEFGTGLFYVYACVNARLLLDNLSGDSALATRTVEAFISALAETSPKGKQNSYASRTRALYGMVEIGAQQPRSLAAAFLKAVGPNEADGDVFEASVRRLEELRQGFERAYGAGADKRAVMNVVEKQGTLAELCALAAEATSGAPCLEQKDAA
jgi:CRISPR system Cascade subunit CasC